MAEATEVVISIVPYSCFTCLSTPEGDLDRVLFHTILPSTARIQGNCLSSLTLKMLPRSSKLCLATDTSHHGTFASVLRQHPYSSQGCIMYKPSTDTTQQGQRCKACCRPYNACFVQSRGLRKSFVQLPIWKSLQVDGAVPPSLLIEECRKHQRLCLVARRL